jgi:hypothetical protein
MRSFVLTLLSAAVSVLAAPLPLPDPVCYAMSTTSQYVVADLMVAGHSQHLHCKHAAGWPDGARLHQ